jgi:zinc transporter ZupT
MGSILFFALLAGTAPLIAAVIPFIIFKNGINQRPFNILLGLSAGLLFSIATLELIPEAMSMAQTAPDRSPTGPKTIEARHLLQIYSHRYLSVSEQPLTPTVDNGEHEDHGGHEGPEEHEEHEENNIRTAMIGVGAGFMFLILVEEVMSLSGMGHSHGAHTGKDESDDEEDQRAGHSHAKPPGLRSSLSAVAFVGLAFHSLIDGMIIAGAFTASPEVGSRVALAILLHKFPDGFVMSSIVASQQSTFQTVHPFTYIVLIAGMTPLGAVIGVWLMGSFSTLAVAFILGFGAGTFLFITAGGILPELLQAKGTDKMISLACILAGYLGFLFIDTSLHAH